MAHGDVLARSELAICGSFHRGRCGESANLLPRDGFGLGATNRPSGTRCAAITNTMRVGLVRLDPPQPRLASPMVAAFDGDLEHDECSPLIMDRDLCVGSALGLVAWWAIVQWPTWSITNQMIAVLFGVVVGGTALNTLLYTPLVAWLVSDRLRDNGGGTCGWP